MTDSRGTIDTIYGVLDKTAFENAQENFETMTILRMVDQLDEAVSELAGEEGVREMLMRLHAMLHTLINNAPLAASDGPSITETLDEIKDSLSNADLALYQLRKALKPLEALQPKD